MAIESFIRPPRIPRRFSIPEEEAPRARPELDVPEQEDETAWEGTSPLGSPRFEVVTIAAGKEQVPEAREWERLTLPATTTLQLSRSKKVVETETVGGGAFVVQGIHSGRYDVRLQGQLVSENRFQRPLEQAARLERIYLMRAGLEVENSYLNERGIYMIYLRSLTLTPSAQFLNVVDFSIDARQLIPVSLELKDEEDAPPAANESSAKPLNTTPKAE